METKINNTRYITKFYHTQLPDYIFDNVLAEKKCLEMGKKVSERSYMKPEAVTKKLLRQNKFKRTTSVKIFTFADGKLSETPVAEGSVTCHPNDDYVKSFGRFYAFRNALENTTDETISKNRFRMLQSYIQECHVPQELFATVALEGHRTR